jgi:hypothetical protein
MNKRFCCIIAIVILCFLSLPVCAKHKHLEKEYQAAWCNAHNGIMEYKLDDNTRVDCLTNEYAVEFDFASKWAESIGQSLYYALKTDLKPAVVLIMEKPAKDLKYLNRLYQVSNKFGITVYTMSDIETPDK